MNRLLRFSSVIAVILTFVSCTASDSEQKMQESKNEGKMDEMINIENLQTTTLGAGCFWCVEAVFDELEGVHSVESGYMGGHTDNPTYKDICTGTTGHAEVIQLKYDPEITTFDEILEVFWTVHDPTTLNRQGNDVGTQYRSAIFYHSDEQKSKAELYKSRLNEEEAFTNPVVTEITKAEKFYIAEDYHQEYFANNPEQAYCSFVVAPKVEKFRKVFKNKLKKSE